MQGLVASTVGTAVSVGEGVCDGVGGTGVSVEVGMGVLVGVLAGRGVAQADKIKAKASANLASHILFIFRSLLDALFEEISYSNKICRKKTIYSCVIIVVQKQASLQQYMYKKIQEYQSKMKRG